MFNLIFTEEFKKNFDKLKDKDVRARILKKAIELKSKPTMGRTLTGIDDAHFGRLYRLRVGTQLWELHFNPIIDHLRPISVLSARIFPQS